MKLVAIPKEKFESYRLDVIFDGYKWDPQYLDNSTVASYILVITEDEHARLMSLTEKLAEETVHAEQFLIKNQKLIKPLALPGKIRRELSKVNNYNADVHIRLMRFDFHPTVEGDWKISEVNSDVPGGLAEASILPDIAAGLLGNNLYNYINLGDKIADAIKRKVKPGGRIVMVHCTSYSDDRQVMQFMGDKLLCLGFKIIYAAADHLSFENNKARCILDGNKGAADAIFRFNPIEWLIDIKPKRWQGYFNTTTSSCNHPIAVFAQTKRFPLIWGILEKQGISLTVWRDLLPETLEVDHAKGKEGFIYKPVYGRVGERISIKEACKDDEYEKIIKDVRRNPKNYLAQKMFFSLPLKGEHGEEFHVCIGSFAVDGTAAGYYARISKTPRIDSGAADIPVLIERG